MTRFTQQTAAAFAAILIVTVSFTTVVTVPPVEAATLVAAPALA